MSIIQLTIPNNFSTILKKNTKYEAEALRLITDFSQWVKDNKLEFFPEYTDHGIEHIQSVLNTAENIINNESLEILTPEDIFVLISAILLHDCAMHLDKHGLWSLLNNDKFNGAVLGNPNKSTWKEKWEKFKQDVHKYEESDWNNFFGHYETVDLPEIGEQNLEDNQKIIIGDFLRQQHADIAQVIASFGIPKKDGSYDIFNDNFTSLNELSGFIARSHNYNLRDMVDALGGEQPARDSRNAHPAFLMGILRIADYLQFEQDRTPKVLFNIKGKGMCSPISIGEWKKHLSILNSNKNHSDAELLFVEALPDDAQTLEGISRLFSGFQKELDSFWAVIGEIYSRYPELSVLGIKYRRIKSNIDNPTAYIEQNHKRFYPEILNIKSDNQKILPLLVSPLYGDIPQIGFRELIQNSIDACNERYSKEIQKEVNLEDIPYGITVTINVDENTFTIEDEGLGMDIDVIKNYFLKVGASYRYSEAWKATHSQDGKTYVPRTGKFGIGMLAGFLIGDTISVTSKKEGLPNDKSIEFTYSLNETNIQVNFINLTKSGTKIVIQSDEIKLKKLLKSLEQKEEDEESYYHNRDDWNSFWYHLDTPIINVNVITDNKSTIRENPYLINKANLPLNWKNVKNTELEGFYWKINKRWSKTNNLYCNGILIRDFHLPSIIFSIGFCNLKIGNLEILVFDNKGLFPLNLTRDNLLTKDFFEIEKLKTSVITDYFKRLKAYLPLNTMKWNQKKVLEIINQYYNDNDIGKELPFVFYQNSIIPIGNSKLDNKYVLFDFTYKSQKRGIIYAKDIFSQFKNCGYCSIANVNKQVYFVEMAISRFIFNIPNDRRYYSFRNFEPLNKNNIFDLDGWVFVKKYDFDKLSNYEKNILKKLDIIVTEINQKWIVLSNKNNSTNIPNLGKEIINQKGLNSFIFAIVKFNKFESIEYNELWNKYM